MMRTTISIRLVLALHAALAWSAACAQEGATALAADVVPVPRFAGTPAQADESRRGWHFHDDPPAEPAPPPTPPATRKDASKDTSEPNEPAEVARFRELQKAVERLRIVAQMNPTEANVKRYLDLEAKVVGNASLFADVARRIAWAAPELDPSTRGRPVNALALDVFEKQQAKSRAGAIAELGRDHVLVFLFRSDCPYCHAYAPVLRAFQDRYGIRVVPVSLDGGGIPGFTDVRPDDGISKRLHVAQVPAVFIAEPHGGSVVPLGFGVLSESELIERIVTTAGRSTDAIAQGSLRQSR